MTLEQIARLYVIFKTLQPEIKEWIASDDTSAIVKAISARFILSDEQERKLPLLILRLVTQDLPPESFKAELIKETDVDAELAKNITEAIAKEVIEPIAAPLRYCGVNTNLLGFNAPATPTQTAPIAIAPAPQPAIQEPTNEAPPTAEVKIKPFILHEEPRATASTVPDGGRSFNYSRGTESSEKNSPRVVIERVVHYSQLRTPLNIASTNNNILSGGRAQPKLPQSKWFI
jgi:hypothetical protein